MLVVSNSNDAKAMKIALNSAALIEISPRLCGTLLSEVSLLCNYREYP